MWRLNTQETQIDICIEKSVYAISRPRKNPAMYPGELLLLQLVENKIKHRHRLKYKINFAIVFDHLEQDIDGTLSRLYWPDAGQTWPWVIIGSATIPTVPFNLEDLGLKSYKWIDNPRHIDKEHEAIIQPYVQWNRAEAPASALELTPANQVSKKFGQELALATIYTHDRIEDLHPASKRLIHTETFVRNQWLSESLKAYYDSC